MERQVPAPAAGSSRRDKAAAEPPQARNRADERGGGNSSIGNGGAAPTGTLVEPLLIVLGDPQRDDSAGASAGRLADSRRAVFAACAALVALATGHGPIQTPLRIVFKENEQNILSGVRMTLWPAARSRWRCSSRCAAVISASQHVRNTSSWPKSWATFSYL